MKCAKQKRRPRRRRRSLTEMRTHAAPDYRCSNSPSSTCRRRSCSLPCMLVLLVPTRGLKYTIPVRTYLPYPLDATSPIKNAISHAAARYGSPSTFFAGRRVALRRSFRRRLYQLPAYPNQHGPWCFWSYFGGKNVALTRSSNT